MAFDAGLSLRERALGDVEQGLQARTPEKDARGLSGENRSVLASVHIGKSALSGTDCDDRAGRQARRPKKAQCWPAWIRADQDEKMTDTEILDNLVLDHNEWRGLQQLSKAISEFEPLAKRARLGPVIADRLVAMKLAEKGEASERYIGIGYEIGYRLSELGWAVLDRGRWPRPRRA